MALLVSVPINRCKKKLEQHPIKQLGGRIDTEAEKTRLLTALKIVTYFSNMAGLSGACPCQTVLCPLDVPTGRSSALNSRRVFRTTLATRDSPDRRNMSMIRSALSERLGVSHAIALRGSFRVANGCLTHSSSHRPILDPGVDAGLHHQPGHLLFVVADILGQRPLEHRPSVAALLQQIPALVDGLPTPMAKVDFLRPFTIAQETKVC